MRMKSINARRGLMELPPRNNIAVGSWLSSITTTISPKALVTAVAVAHPASHPARTRE
jgi:hypothetical protein